MSPLKLSNPFRRGADRPTLKQRAAELRSGLGRSAQPPEADLASVPPTVPTPPAVSSELADMVTEWADVRQRYDLATQDDQTEEGDTLFERILTLQPTIYAFPVASVADLCAKLPVLQNEFSDIAVGPDPANPYWLRQAADAVLRDLASLSDALPTAEDDEPLTTESAASLDFEAVHIPTPVRTPRQWQERFAPHTLGLHMADRVLRMSKAELVAFIRGADARDGDLPGSLINALGAARSEAQTYAELLDAAWTRFLVAGSTIALNDEQGGPQIETPDTEPTWSAASTSLRSEPSLIGQIDFASGTMEDLRSLRDIANSVADVAYAMAWTGRCHTRAWGDHDLPGEQHNAAGKLMQWLGEALADVADEARKEAQRRRPKTPCDRETRLTILAGPTIESGDPDETAAFAGEMGAHVVAELAGH